MRHHLISFIAGLLFAIGLGIAGMTLPEKILGFLDFTGAWDPSMMFVMGGAAGVYAIAYPLIVRHPFSVFKEKFALPTRTDIDARLIGGAALFGLGWGLGGLCPGPALTSLVTLSPGVWTFTLAMVVGMGLHEAYQRLSTPFLQRLERIWPSA